jgi:UDP-glucuronate 4-epimerase
MKVLLTGVAGFIGFHLAQALLGRGDAVLGIDNLNSYYDPSLKKDRLNLLLQHANCDKLEFIKGDIADRGLIEDLFKSNQFDVVVNLAAQAGVRYSLEKPHQYIDSNIVGFTNILEGCRYARVKHFVYASSSSVYGMNVKQPFSTKDYTDSPVSLYAATKKSNELMAYTYSHLFRIPTTGLRFFTVYGPYGRPDMAYYKFTQAILNGDTIDVYNNGDMQRDFTYIDDIIEGVLRSIDNIPVDQVNELSGANPPYKLFNIGNNSPITLTKFIDTIEMHCGKTAVKNFLPMQPGDVPATYADIDDLIKEVDFRPTTTVETGLGLFIAWYKKYAKEMRKSSN